ncbi:hypothetical protein BDW72DRAFT_177883 [Aspergillus terricola var. indicus]
MPRYLGDTWTKEENQRLLRLRDQYYHLNWHDFHKLDLFPGRSGRAVQIHYSRLRSGRARTARGQRRARKWTPGRTTIQFESRSSLRRRSSRARRVKAGMYKEKTQEDLPVDSGDETVSESEDEERDNDEMTVASPAGDTRQDSSLASTELPLNSTATNIASISAPVSTPPTASSRQRTATGATHTSQSQRIDKDLWDFSAISASTLERPSIASPVTEPRGHPRAPRGTVLTRENNLAESSSSRTELGGIPRSTLLRPIPRPRRAQEGLTEQDPTALPESNINSPSPQSLAEEFQTEVNMLLTRHFQKIKDLESRLSQYMAENSNLKNKLASTRTPAEWDHLEAQIAEKAQINNDLVRQVNELAADKRGMEEELKKLDSLRQAIRQLDVFRSWTSAQS